MNYYVKEINACESRILDKIDIIRRYGATVSEYEKRLQDITSSEENYEVIVKDISVAASVMTLEMANLDALNKLKALEDELDNYQEYLKIHFRNSSLINDIKNTKNITDEKIDLYVHEAKSLLHDTLNINIDSVKDLKKIIKDVYSTIYEIIKLELVMNGKSNILSYIVNYDQGIYYINDLVREEINKLEEEKKLDEQITKVMDELSKDGINYKYADDRLILLLTLKNKDLVLSKFNDQAKLYDKEINDIKCNIDKMDDCREDAFYNSNKYKRKRNKSQRNAFIGSVMLALNLLAYKIAPSTCKDIHTTTTYMTNIEAYDTVSGEIHEENIYLPKGEQEYTELKVFGEVDKNGRRTVTTYDLSKIDMEDISKYPEMIDDNSLNKTKQDIKYRLGEQLSRDEYMVVERLSYGEEKVELDEEAYNNDLKILLFLIYFLGGTSIKAMLTYLLLAIHNNRKFKKEIEEYNNYDTQIDTYERKIENYKKLKNELIELKKDYIEDNLDLDDYKKVLRK